MDVVVNEDYWQGCEKEWKDKYRVERIREVEVRAGEKRLLAGIIWQELDKRMAWISGDNSRKWLSGGDR